MIIIPIDEMNALAQVYGVDDPDAGHTFFISVRTQTSSCVDGDAHNSDADFVYGAPLMLAVRASNLPAALRRAALAPLGAWARDGVLLSTDEPVPARAAVVHPDPERKDPDAC